MQAILDKAILASRWLLAVFFLGLAAALGVYALRFLYKLWSFAAGVLAAEDTRLLIQLLHLLDAALVASLVAIVAISSYDSLVSRLGKHEAKEDLAWVSAIDPGNLKVKLAAALVAISSIQLLQVFMELDAYTDRAVSWALALHAAFLAGLVVLALTDRLAEKKK